jgi:hypothetical protein
VSTTTVRVPYTEGAYASVAIRTAPLPPEAPATEFAEVPLHTFNIKERIFDLLLDHVDLFDRWLLTPDDSDVIRNLNGGEWYSEMYKEHCCETNADGRRVPIPNRHLLPLFLFVDALLTSNTSQHSEKPVILSLGLLPQAVLRTERGKILVAFINTCLGRYMPAGAKTMQVGRSQ